MLGGTSSINYQLYMRGSHHDYDSWQENGATGWSYKEVLPYFMKSENADHYDLVDRKFHGRDGPVHVSYTAKVGITEAMLTAGKEIG